MDIDEFKLLMEEYGVVASNVDGMCSTETCDYCIPSEVVCTNGEIPSNFKGLPTSV